MMRSMIFNIILFCSFWSLVSARPLLTVPIVSKELRVNDPSLPPAVKNMCDGGLNATTVLGMTPFGDGGGLLVEGSCAPPASNNSDSVTNLTVEEAVCPTALNNCNSRFGDEFQQFNGLGYVAKCGAPCTSTCYPGNNGPDPNDCQTIINQLYSQNPQLFTLGENRFVLFLMNSCGIGIQNQIASSPLGCNTTMIYDYADVGAIAQYLAWNCQAPQGAAGGRCRGNTGIFQPAVPDFYVQVYRNMS